MKKAISLILSVALLLSLTAGFCVLNLSAVESPYAEEQAQILWTEANKATSAAFFFSDDTYYTIPNNTTDLKAARGDLFSSGAVTFQNGVLTLTNVSYVENPETTPTIYANGGLKVNLVGGDLEVNLRVVQEETLDYTPGAKSPLIVTSPDGSALISTSRQCLLADSGAIVTYGPLRLNFNTSGADCVMVSGATLDYPIILGNTGESLLSAGLFKPTIESRSGSIIICGSGNFTVKNTNIVTSSTECSAVYVNENAAKNAAIKVMESVNLTVETVGGSTVNCSAAADKGHTAIDISTSGTVKLSSSSLNLTGVENGNLVYAKYGSIRVSSKVLAQLTVGKRADRCGAAFFSDNDGGDFDAGVIFYGNADVAVNVLSNVANAKVTGIWVDTGVVRATDNAKLTVRYEHQNTVSGNFSAMVFRVGALSISDHAKVYLYGSNSGSGDVSDEAVLVFQGGTVNETAARNHFKDNAGLHVSGGQLEVNASSRFVLYGFLTNMRGGTHFTGGLVSVKNPAPSGKDLFPSSLTEVSETHYNIVENAAYCGPVTLFDGTKITEDKADYYNKGEKYSGDVAEYLYAAADASYVAYDGISENADFFGNLSTKHNDFSYFTKALPYKASLTGLNPSPTHGDTVGIHINASHDAEKTYASAQLTLQYDPAALAFQEASSQLNGAGVSAKDGILKIVDYGADKSLKDGLYTLSFTTLKSGDTSVTLVSAFFGDKVSVEEKDLTAAALSSSTVTLSVQKKTFAVTLPVGFEGSDTVVDGDDYTFTLTDNNYNYTDFTAKIEETPLNIRDNRDGTYTVLSVFGNLTVTANRTPKTYTATFTPDTVLSTSGTPTYKTDFTFTIKENVLPGLSEGYNYSLQKITIGGVDFADYDISSDGRTVTVPGERITGNLEVTVKVDSVAPNQVTVSLAGNGAGDVTTSHLVADKGQAFSVTVAPVSGYRYSVSATMGGAPVNVTVSGSAYTVANVTSPLVFTVTKSPITDQVTAYSYLTLAQGKTMYLVLNTYSLEDGMVSTLNDIPMFWSEKYGGYCGLMILNTTSDATAVAKSTLSVVDGTTLSVDYGMDVNKTGKVDAADAQLVYNMYNTAYSDFTPTVSQEKFLRADVNGDKKLDVTDATAIVAQVLK